MLKIYSQNSNIDGYYTVATPLSDSLGGEVFFLLPESLVKAAIRPQLLASALFILLLTGLLFYVCYLVSRLLTRQYEINNLRMELELLQLRFNPHLLYNTLNALCYQIKNPSARSTVGSLCQYYRIVLNNGYLLIQVKDEIEMLKEYLKIETFAYALDRITIEYNIDERVLDCWIIKHLLQPVVENAIHHGLQPLEQPGKLLIRILAAADGGRILFEITDNGIGMSVEKIKELLSPPRQGAKGGYGIYNVEQRIRTYYGQGYHLQIHSTPAKGTTVSWELPTYPPKI